MDNDEIKHIEPPKISEHIRSVVDEMIRVVNSEEFRSARIRSFNYKPIKISDHNYVPTPTMVGVQMQLEQSEKLLTNHLKFQRRYVPIEFPQIVICEHVPKKIVYLRPLRRKSSRRWVKKWTKRGWKTEVDQMLKVGGTMILSENLHDRIWQRTREDINRELRKLDDMIYQHLMSGFWGR